MSAAPRELHTFDLRAEIARIQARGVMDPAVVVGELLAAIPPAEVSFVLAAALDIVVRGSMRPTPPVRRQRPGAGDPPAGSAKVSAIRSAWQQPLGEFAFTGYAGRPTTLLDATYQDLLTAAADRLAMSQLAAKEGAFLRGVAKAVHGHGVERVADLPQSVQRAIAERIPS
ncbi:MAG: hypothetical protein AB7O74_11670 [Candidatus Nanopelagicales bacterium]